MGTSMADVTLTQAEADALIAIEKHRVNDDGHDFPLGGQSLMLPLQSPDRREMFMLDISRGRIDLMRGKYQNRARHTVILVRLDLGGPPHRNPDGAELVCPHLHVYREGYGDKWAISAPPALFPNTSDLWITLDDFFRYCNVTQPPRIERGLFT
jgi:hypothetical protein